MSRHSMVIPHGSTERPVRVIGPATPDPRSDMRPCTICGGRDLHRMHALMSQWYGPFAGLEPDHAYFYLCPGCFSLYIPVPDPFARG
jgi:hypothetical protein